MLSLPPVQESFKKSSTASRLFLSDFLQLTSALEGYVHEYEHKFRILLDLPARPHLPAVPDLRAATQSTT
jgi:hypothetical protein